MHIENKLCHDCDIERLHRNGKCSYCMEKAHRLERARWMALTPDEKIEELLKRIAILERGPLQYG